MKIKICGIKSIEEARNCIQAGADYIGINLIPTSKRYWANGPRAIAESWHGSTAHFVWVVADQTLEKVAQLCTDTANTKAIQFHGNEDVAFLAQVRSKISSSIEIWKAVGITDQDSVIASQAFASSVDLILFDKGKGRGVADGGSGKTFDWSLLAHRPSTLHPYGIAGGITPENVSGCLKYQPALVDTATGVEGTDGRKSTDRVKALIAAAKS